MTSCIRTACRPSWPVKWLVSVFCLCWEGLACASPAWREGREGSDCVGQNGDMCGAEWWHCLSPAVGQLRKTAGCGTPSSFGKAIRTLTGFVAARSLFCVYGPQWYDRRSISSGSRFRPLGGGGGGGQGPPLPCLYLVMGPRTLLALSPAFVFSLSALLAKKHKYVIFFIVESLLFRKCLNNKINENNILINQIR